jgi:hypothetical protein
MSVGLADVHDPTVSVGKVTLKGTKATAIALTTARGQKASIAAIELRKTRQGWRITSLGSPLAKAHGG